MNRTKLFLTVSALLLMNSCYYFSTYHTARMLDRTEFDVSGIASVQKYNEEKGMPKDNNRLSQFGVQGGFGFSKRFNLRGGYMLLLEKDIHDSSYTTINSDGDADDLWTTTYLYLEPKLGLGSRDHFALTLPLGLSLYGDEAEMFLSPTAIASINPSDQVSLSLAVKGVWNLSDQEILPAYTTAIAFTPRKIPLVVTPEFGMIFENNGASTLSFGVGLGYMKHNRSTAEDQ